jgi:hypothetical protein
LASGDEESVSRWFQRITESTTEHLDWPIPYVRSFFFLGKIHEDRGEVDDYWRDGDIDRERVEEALSNIQQDPGIARHPPSPLAFGAGYGGSRGIFGQLSSAPKDERTAWPTKIL